MYLLARCGTHKAKICFVFDRYPTWLRMEKIAEISENPTSLLVFSKQIQTTDFSVRSAFADFYSANRFAEISNQFLVCRILQQFLLEFPQKSNFVFHQEWILRFLQELLRGFLRKFLPDFFFSRIILDIPPDIPLGFHSGISAETPARVLPRISPGITPGISSGITPGIYSRIDPGFLPWIPPKILPGFPPRINPGISSLGSPLHIPPGFLFHGSLQKFHRWFLQ